MAALHHLNQWNTALLIIVLGILAYRITDKREFWEVIKAYFRKRR